MRVTSSTKSTSFELIARASPTARVVLPSAEDHDDGSEYESAQEDVEENEEDPFEDFPDDVEVRDSSSSSPEGGSFAIQRVGVIRNSSSCMRA